MALMVDVGANYRSILERISTAAGTVGRDAREIRLLAASKSQPVDAIRAALAAGVVLVGENYVQEAQEKKRQLADAKAEWHMIGHLQRNKAKWAVELFDVIESLDSLALARELDKASAKLGKIVRTFIEVNLSGEQSKTGIAKGEVGGLLANISGLGHVCVEGLMTVPPYRENLEDVRPYFRELRELRDLLNSRNFPNVQLKELSMGMTHDFTVAIEEGATIVRVGTALFGPRRS
ncbi:MAG TPA: YggS family pyridoxal phosphate-dependent enzyme [Candidatus Binatia bacterium]|nr:YggS family pyridoxal phosphate-dependent enzyme [Candidatus Binatia bacterium]